MRGFFVQWIERDGRHVVRGSAPDECGLFVVREHHTTRRTARRRDVERAHFVRLVLGNVSRPDVVRRKRYFGRIERRGVELDELIGALGRDQQSVLLDSIRHGTGLGERRKPFEHVEVLPPSALADETEGPSI